MSTITGASRSKYAEYTHRTLTGDAPDDIFDQPDRALRGAHGVSLAAGDRAGARGLSRARAGRRRAERGGHAAPEYALEARGARGRAGRAAEADAQPLRRARATQRGGRGRPRLPDGAPRRVRDRRG